MTNKNEEKKNMEGVEAACGTSLTSSVHTSEKERNELKHGQRCAELEGARGVPDQPAKELVVVVVVGVVNVTVASGSGRQRQWQR